MSDLWNRPAGNSRVSYSGSWSDTASTIFCAQLKQPDWHARLVAGALADAIIEPIVHNASRVANGGLYMREACSSGED